jgi:nitrogen fixation NifU-like protein
MDIYAENILDHFRHPRHFAPLLHSSMNHEEWNHACGDSLHLWLLLKDGKIAEVGWTGTGCAISQASMSILSEEMPGMSEEKILSLTKEDIYTMLGVPIGPRRFKCALMSLHTVKNAILKVQGKPVQGWVETVGLEKN